MLFLSTQNLIFSDDKKQPVKTVCVQFPPAVNYLTSISIGNLTALKKEADAIKKVIGNVFPGIDKDKKYILYSAFNSLPGSKNAAKHFDFTDKLN